MRLRCLTVIACAVFVAFGSIAAPGPALAGSAECGASPPGNGTGYRPPSNRSSLPSGSPLPGPEILYQPLATSPQLENADPWAAPPIMISGTRAYRDGEFVYQDFLYDDRALTYPAEPERYAGNAADFVEVRLTPLDDALAIRLSFNSMLQPDAVATTIALGDSAQPLELPHNAGAVAPGEIFVTVHGCSGDISRASDGTTLDVVPVVTSDLTRRQVDVRVPYEAFDPRGQDAVRVAVAAGLWDAAADAYLRPDPALPAFFNVAFREYGPWTQNTWMDVSQNEALAAADLSPLFATVDFTKLAAGVDDDLVDQPGGVPSHGPMNRILVSHFEPAQGRGNDGGGGLPCHAPECTHQYSGQLQPYSAYIPSVPAPSDGYGLVVNIHGANSNHNHFETGPPDPPTQTWQMFAEAGRPSIMVLPNARGTTYWYHGLAAADVFEVWADIAGRYDLHPGYVVQTGSSMGGYGTYKFGTQFPDLYNGIFPNVGINFALAGGAISPSGGGDAWRMFASLRNVPVLATSGLNDPVVSFPNTSQSMATLDQLGYRYDYWWMANPDGITAHLGHAEYRHQVPEEYVALMGRYGPIDRDPRRVTYVLNATMSEPDYGLTADHAYWLSGLALRDEAATFGTIDIASHGFATGDPAPPAQQQDAGTTQVDSLPYERLTREWGDAPVTEVADVLDVTATNVASVTIDVDRARVSCTPTVNVESDGPLEVTLTGRRCGAPVVTIAGPDDDPASVAIAWSQRTFAPGEATEALYASDEVFADALASGPLQATRPLLLGDPETLEEPVLAELRRLGVEQVRILGGTVAVSDAVADALRAAGYAVVRTAGPTRLETATAIAGLTDGPDALLARAFGDDQSSTRAFADSLGAGAWAAQTGDPLLLTDTADLSAAPRAALAARQPTEVAIIGGVDAVSEQVLDRLAGDGHGHRRVAGADRAATAVAIAEARGFGPTAPAHAIVLVDGDALDGWTRGLPAGGFAARTGSAVLLATGDALPEATAAFIADAVVPAEGATVVWCAASTVACAAAEAAIND